MIDFKVEQSGDKRMPTGNGELTITQEAETGFDMVRNREISVIKGLIDLTLSPCDYIKIMFDNPNSKAGELIASFKKLSPDTKEQKEVNTCSPASSSYENNPESGPLERNITYRIRFCLSPDIFTKGINPGLLINELSTQDGGTDGCHPSSKNMVERLRTIAWLGRWNMIKSLRNINKPLSPPLRLLYFE